ncbi:MAG: hypothetical protein LBP72_06335, partial [Dysgonamonadaceae bacterium]|nr:hypothetical protein [Dysgonamonadaceae bacterium]
MSLRKVTGSLLTPILGMTPIVSFLVLSFFFSYPVSLLGAIATFLVFFLVDFWTLKYTSPYTTYLSIIAFSLSALFSVIPPFTILYEHYSTLFFEITVVFVFSVFMIFKNYFRGKILFKNEDLCNFHLIRFDADVYVVKIAVHLATTHLMIVMIYRLLPTFCHSESLDKFLHFILLYIFITLHFIYEFVHFYFLRKRYLLEEWWPVVDETGIVHGKIASSISRSLGNKYLHPVIRISLIHNGKIFLKEKAAWSAGNTTELDYPFETYLKYQESLEEGVMRVFEENGGTKDLPACYLLHYVFKDIKTNRLIYLYISNIQNISDLPANLNKGKWWTRKQIEENLGKGFFSSCFEKEFELLSNTILAADRIIQK